MAKSFLYILLMCLTLQVGCDYGSVSSLQTIQGSVSLQMNMWVNRGCAKPGDLLEIQYTIINNGKEKVVLTSKDHSVMDIRIHFQTVDEPVTLLWSDNKPQTSDLQELILEPGQSKAITWNWFLDSRIAPSESVAIEGFADLNAVGNKISSITSPASVVVETGMCHQGPLGP